MKKLSAMWNAVIPLSRLTRPFPLWLTLIIVVIIGVGALFVVWRQAEFVDVAIFTDISRADAFIEEGAYWLDESQTSPFEHRRMVGLDEFSRAQTKLEEARHNIDLLGDPQLSNDIEEAIKGVERMIRIAASPHFDLDEKERSLFMTARLQTKKLVTQVTEGTMRLRQVIIAAYQKKLFGLALAALVLTLIAFRGIVSLARQEVRAKEEYARLQERYRHMVEGIQDILFIYQTAPEPKFVYVSPGIEDLFGVDADAHYLNPRLWHDRVEDEHQLEEVLSGMRPPHEPHLLCLKGEGGLRWLEMAVTPFSDTGGVVTLLGILRDVTEHREAQERLQHERDRAEEATRMKDKFVALVSHDIRSPLSSLLGLLSLLAGRDDTFLLANGRMILQKSVDSGHHLLELTNQLLALAQIQSGELVLKKERVDLHDRAEATIGILEGAAMAKEVTIENRIPASLAVIGDKLLLGQVIQNLLSNAIKFTPRKGKVVIGGEGDDDAVRFWGEDTGMGIDPERINGLFDAAVCRSTLGTEQERGVGFGLPMVREIVEAHNGTIGVFSTLGEGSRFTITLPIAG